MRTNKELYQSVIGTLHASGNYQFQEEDKTMKRSKRLVISSLMCNAAVIAAILILMVGSVYAAVRLLTPSEVAGLFEDEILAEAFSSENAVIVNETQTIGEYEITFLGMISGPGTTITFSALKEDDVRKDVSNFVFAVNRTDGEEITDAEVWGVYPAIDLNEWDVHEPLPSYHENNFFTPLIGGCEHTKSDYLLTGVTGASRLSEDGRTIYMIFTCSNIEYLADHDLYVCVHDGEGVWRTVKDNTMWKTLKNDPEKTAYYYDPETGIYTRNEEYNGFNALFRVPVDPSKADPVMAQTIRDYKPKIETAEDFKESREELFERVNQEAENVILNSANYRELAEPVEGTRADLVPDEDGNVLVPGYKIYDHEGGDVVMMVTDHTEPYSFYKDFYFKNKEPGSGLVVFSGSVGTDDQLIKLYEVFILNEDESITYEVYEMRFDQ